MTDANDRELADAQRELEDAAREMGATVEHIRAPGGVTPDALRAVAKSIREIAREPERGDPSSQG